MSLAPWKLNRTLVDASCRLTLSAGEWALTLVACARRVRDGPSERMAP
jgi:hypothetical protein